MDIIQQHAYSAQQSEHWINFLTPTFRDTTLDGYTRHRAIVRLLYIYYIYHGFDEMKTIMNEFESTPKSPYFIDLGCIIE